MAVSPEIVSFASEMKQKETILTITGSDSTGESGVQADIRTISALGGRAVSAITSITLQNSLGIQEFYDLPAGVVEGQIEAVVDDERPQVVKIGMLRSVELVSMVARVLRKYQPRYVVYDPVVRSAHGDVLMSAEVVLAVQQELVPLCTYVVRREEKAVHGHANLFSSALCVYLSQGEEVEQAVAHARQYVGQQAAGVKSDGSGRAGELYRMFVETMEQFYKRYNDVAFYAEQIGVSSRYLSQVTKRVSGKSPKTLIEERLLSQVERELTAGQKTLKQLAAELGFSSQAHLTRFFRKQKGLSPSKYKGK